MYPDYSLDLIKYEQSSDRAKKNAKANILKKLKNDIDSVSNIIRAQDSVKKQRYGKLDQATLAELVKEW